ncbi:MAG: hypothetical protein CM1200mP30_29720 [Pseudomonadota bacterium]|nr:MAG: hypothetical protein CM1200mP30_29720 [Pseudomonadota bacterium]
MGPYIAGAQALGVDVDSVWEAADLGRVRLCMLPVISPNPISTQNLKIFLQ